MVQKKNAKINKGIRGFWVWGLGFDVSNLHHFTWGERPTTSAFLTEAARITVLAKDGGFHKCSDTPSELAGWFTMEKPNLKKRMISGGPPI